MKVLSIKEPYASLIMQGIKKIETRSWKTKYRGELYIHASLTNVKQMYYEKEGLKDLIADMEMHYGQIICKCNLVDCIEMTSEYIENMARLNPVEYCCGAYEIGRYAWVLDDVEIVTPISVKGKLGIWNYEQ